jgi:hypothetical protein
VFEYLLQPVNYNVPVRRVAHNAAGTGGGSFSGASVSFGFNVEDLSVDIYYWFATFNLVSFTRIHRGIIYRESYTLIPRYLTLSTEKATHLSFCDTTYRYIVINRLKQVFKH